jgi:hypothetical protein
MTNGTIEPLTQMSKGELRDCIARIRVPDDYQIQLSCSAIDMSSDMSYLRVILTLNYIFFQKLRFFSEFRSTES